MHFRPIGWKTLFVCLTISFSTLAANRNNSTCDITPGQPLRNSYGPWDYTNPEHRAKLPIVLGAHFTQSVETLQKGNRGSLISDLDYTLRAIPNYHRALASMAKYQRRQKLNYKAMDKYYTVDCYFKRAFHLQPNDALSRMLYAMHLHISDKHSQAKEQYDVALALSPNNPEIHYNLGLLLVDMNHLREAAKHASFAYENGYPLPGLRNKLASVGVSIPEQ